MVCNSFKGLQENQIRTHSKNDLIPRFLIQGDLMRRSNVAVRVALLIVSIVALTALVKRSIELPFRAS